MWTTDIYQPLAHFYSQRGQPGLPRHVFLLTDGDVEQPEAVVQLVGQNVGRARCHTLGIGSGGSRELVRRTAIAGQGSFHFVADTETEALNAKVIASLAAACKPALASL